MASYLNSPLFNRESQSLLLSLSTQIVNGIKRDFKGRYPEIYCPLKCGDEDTLANVMSGSTIQSYDASIKKHNQWHSIQRCFFTISHQTEKHHWTVQQLFIHRMNIENGQPVVKTGLLHCMQLCKVTNSSWSLYLLKLLGIKLLLLLFNMLKKDFSNFLNTHIFFLLSQYCITL